MGDVKGGAVTGVWEFDSGDFLVEMENRFWCGGG